MKVMTTFRGTDATLRDTLSDPYEPCPHAPPPWSDDWEDEP